MRSTVRTFRHLIGVLGVVGPTILAGQTPAPQASGVTISGSVTTSITASNNAAGQAIVGRLYGRRQNEFMLNVGNLTIERVVPTDAVGAGFRVETFFGQNAAVVKSNGLDLGPNADIWQAYVTLNLPMHRADHYLQFKAGKMATLMGVEVGEDVLNPNLDVGVQDIFLEPFTETGVELDAKLGKHADVELRASNGWDQVADLNTRKTFSARLGLTPTERTLIALVGYFGPERADSNGPKRSGVNALFTQKVGSHTSISGQFDYGREEGIGATEEDAAWTAGGVWIAQDLGAKATLALRGDYMNDRDGVRTSGVLGFPVNAGQKVSSLAATLNIKCWEHALVRPEIRYDNSSIAAFDGSKTQLTFAFGLSYLY